jgi:pyruvate formate lyase activating enzyme
MAESSTTSLKSLLAQNTAEADPALVQTAGDAVRCFACAHRCLVKPGRAGVCRVRFRDGHGPLRVPFGYVAGLAVDPLEKKPFFHAFPGRDALSFGMLGCDLHCSYCQNWITSQALRDDAAVAAPRFVTAEQLVDLAIEHDCPVVTSTYNEPLITSEWAVAVMRLARERGLRGAYVSNGNATPEVLEYIRPAVDLYKIDLKCFDDKAYRQLGCTLQSVLDTIRLTKEMGFWVEVVTLVVPGFNDSDEQLRRSAEFLAGVSDEIPWHITAFHPDYKLSDPPRTPPETLLKAYDLGKQAGLKFVYPGNLPGRVDDKEDTYCPNCQEKVIQRTGFQVRRNRLDDQGRCPACETRLPGVWS